MHTILKEQFIACQETSKHNVTAFLILSLLQILPLPIIRILVIVL